MKTLLDKIKEEIYASQALFSQTAYKPAISCLWCVIRSAIFYDLQNKDIKYSSTEEALKEFVKLYQNDPISEDVLFLEIIGTLCEWDEYYTIDHRQASKCREIARTILSKLVPSINQHSSYYNTLTKEIDRHIEDSRYSLALQYAAATRNESYYTRFLKFGFIISLIGLSALFYLITCDTAPGILISQLITLGGAGLTIWPLVNDYSGKAVNHRRFAEAYNRILKMAINWRSDFPEYSNLIEAEKYVKIIRHSLILVNSLSPVTKDSDYQKAKKTIEGGSYNYD